MLFRFGRHKQSVADSSFDAWTRYYKQDENSPNALVSYYTKGSLIALGLDLTIRHATQDQHSLDDVMRLLWQRYGRDFYLGAGQGLPEQAFVKLVREACGVDISSELTRWVEGTEDVPLKKLLAGQGISLTFKSASKLPSLDVRVRKQGEQLVLATVFEHGAAHQAGLSAMDALVAINGLRVEASPAALDTLLERHQVGETAKNSVGPQLNGLIGRHSGAVEGYNYSEANKNSGLTWDEATFKEYIKNPRAKVPGTKMVFAGITNETEIDNLVAYLKQFDKDGKKK